MLLCSQNDAIGQVSGGKATPMVPAQAALYVKHGTPTV